MASEAVLKELFQVAKSSRQFAGMSDSDIWKACLAYQDRSDEDMQKAMENIREKDRRLKNESEQKQKRLEQGKEKMMTLRENETNERRKDTQNAEEILEELFNY